MFKLENEILSVDLPQGHTMQELNVLAREEISRMIAEGLFYGKDLKVNGRITTAMAILLGHELAHVCRSVSIFDPKEGQYVLCIKH